MRAYVMTTGAVFGLITVAHLIRFVMEGAHLAREPLFILLTVLTAALCLWAGLLLRRSARS
ncbi:MAG: hypothetical protein JWM21_3434 [Acidobacteria bacterium]|nr:hypothetical protein [Acidobacteriota bacterium]